MPLARGTTAAVRIGRDYPSMVINHAQASRTALERFALVR
jgi:hypothetical protein